MEKTVNEIAQLVGGMVGGGGSMVVHRLASLDGGARRVCGGSPSADGNGGLYLPAHFRR